MLQHPLSPAPMKRSSSNTESLNCSNLTRKERSNTREEVFTL